MEHFFRDLFGEAVCPERRLAIFTMPNLRTHHFSSFSAAATYACEASKTQDVFFGIGLAGSNFNHRSYASQIVALCGLWADIDLPAPWRAKKTLPETLEQIRTILEKLPFPPTLMVDSGHGLHAYWLFKEPWPLETESMHSLAQRAAWGWMKHVRGAAHSLGFDVDSVGDLARVLRVPGTINHKGETPAEVGIIERHPERRYNPSDFEPFMTDEAPTGEHTVGSITLRPDAEPPNEAFEHLMQYSPAFSAAWERQRPDLEDQSQSAYDLSLATIAALNEWSDQDIADLIVAARRKHNQKPEKALRADYIRRTITAARKSTVERDAAGVDISALLPHASGTESTEPAGPPDPGPLPEGLLRVPGFISEVMDHCLATAPYPNHVMAFAGAVALQAFLAGRRVRDPGDNRTNLYLLGLAHSAAGKDWPRKVNTRIIHKVGLSTGLGERFASGEGIQDALFAEPCMLYQTDEIDGMLQSINKSRDARHENIMGTLLTMYSSANSVFPMRSKATKGEREPPGVIDQPCLVIFGTAIPAHYYEALSERMLTNGFFARMLILESGPRPKGQEPAIRDLPPRVLAVAKWWADYLPGIGNLRDWHPDPVIIQHTDDARSVLVQTREEAEAEYAKAEQAGDPVGTTVWGRVNEQARKLALIYAVSADHEEPRIDKAAAEWATRLVMHQTRRMLFMASEHVADNPFHAECLRVIRKLREAQGYELSHSVLLKRMKMDAKSFGELISTLQQSGDIEVHAQATDGRPHRAYRLSNHRKAM